MPLRTVALLTALLTTVALPGAAGAQPAAEPAPLPEPAIRMVPKAENVAGFLDCIAAQKATIVSAHRGGPAPSLPENAIETFAYTLSKIPAIIELDVVKAKDGYVLMHDSDLNRTTNGSGPVADKTVAELKQLSLRDATGFTPRPAIRIATLEETLAWAKDRAIIQLDLKRGTNTAEIVAAVREAKAQRYTAIIVDDAAEAAIVAKADPVISMSYGVTRLEALDELAAAGVSADRIYAFTGVNRENKALWDELERRGIPTIFATLWQGDREIAATNDEAKYARLSADGVDILVTDRHFDAYWAMEARQDIEKAVKACVM